MALGTNHSTLTTSANFIPELWSDEVIGAYKSNLVVANTVTKMSHKGVKAAGTQVTLIADTASVLNISIDKHYEYSKLIEDIAEVQALASMRKFYTDDAGYALAKQVDDSLFALMEGFQGGTVGGTGAALWEQAVRGGDGSTVFAGATSGGGATDITDAGIRAMILKLDDADVPMDNRVLIVPPIAANDMLAINRFTEQQFIGSGDAIKTGKIGQIYGVDVFVSSNCPTVTPSSGTTARIGALMHKDALVFAEQVGVRTQTQYKQEYLGDLFTADTIYGTGELRNDGGVAFVVPAT